jgi:hypothetical protein
MNIVPSWRSVWRSVFGRGVFASILRRGASRKLPFLSILLTGMLPRSRRVHEGKRQ